MAIGRGGKGIESGISGFMNTRQLLSLEPVENQYFSFITDIFEIITGYTKITWSELNMIWPLAFCQITLFAIVA